MTRAPGLDSIRGLACLMVLVGHATMTNNVPGAYLPDWYATLVSVFAGPGVDLFFVLSGFLITGILLDDLGRPAYFRRFYARRALRILPLYYLALFVAFVVGAPFLHAMHGYDATASQQAWMWLHLTNWKHAIDGQPPWWWLNHFWSLAVEEQFYFVWPALVYLTRGGRSLPIVCGGIIALSPLARTLASELWIYVEWDRITPLRLDGLAMGALVAWGARHAPKSVRTWLPGLGAGSLVLMALWPLLPHALSAAWHTVMNTAAAGAVLWASRGQALRLAAPLRYLGQRSYGAYVYHFPIQCALALWWPYAQTLHPIANHAAFLGVSLTITLAMAEVSWRAWESPWLALRGRAAPVPVSLADQLPGQGRQAVPLPRLGVVLPAGDHQAMIGVALVPHAVDPSPDDRPADDDHQSVILGRSRAHARF